MCMFLGPVSMPIPVWKFFCSIVFENVSFQVLAKTLYPRPIAKFTGKDFSVKNVQLVHLIGLFIMPIIIVLYTYHFL